eukprot:9739958-Alexandrium_andersonii.AAC.1
MSASLVGSEMCIRDRCSTHRDVVIADAPAKLYHRIGRAIAAPVYENYAHGTQFGAISKRGTDHAARMVRAFQRPLVLSAATPEAAISALRNKGIREDIIKYIQDHMCSPSHQAADAQAALPVMAKSMLAAAHHTNWLSVEGDRD